MIGMFGQKEMKKKRPTENTWYDKLIIFSRPQKKLYAVFLKKVVSLFKTKTPDDYHKQN